MKKEAILGFILFIAFLLRFFMLGELPEGFHRDEAFFGYNAYSIFKTGRDMTGDILPLHLESYLYSPALYSYFAIPGIALFGLNEFSTRLPSAIFGVGTVFLLYILTLRLFERYKWKVSLGFFAAFLLAVIPWHVNLSRTTTENTIVVFFLLCGVIVFFSLIKKFTWKSSLFFFGSSAIAFFLYQASRTFLPIFIPFLFLLNFSDLKKKIIPLSLLFVVSILVPLVFILSSKELSLRIQSLSFSATPGTELVLTEDIHQDGKENVEVLITRMFHNKPYLYWDTFLKNYFSHYSYSFLFTDAGFPDRYRIPHIGLLYVPFLPFLFYGVYRMFRMYPKESGLLLGWILLTPIGSALTFDDVPNLQRTMIMLPPLILLISFGVIELYRFSNHHKRLLILGGSFFAMWILFFFYVLHSSVLRSFTSISTLV